VYKQQKQCCRSVLTEDGTDIQLALLQYRDTPIPALGASPAQLLQSRNLRTKLPADEQHLRHKIIKNVPQKLNQYKATYERHYNQHAHRKVSFAPEQPVHVQKRIQGTRSKAKIIAPAGTPRSYVIQTDDGSTLRRSTQHVKPSVDLQTISPAPILQYPQPQNTQPANDPDPHLPDQLTPESAVPVIPNIPGTASVQPATITQPLALDMDEQPSSSQQDPGLQSDAEEMQTTEPGTGTAVERDDRTTAPGATEADSDPIPISEETSAVISASAVQPVESSQIPLITGENPDQVEEIPSSSASAAPAYVLQVPSHILAAQGIGDLPISDSSNAESVRSVSPEFEATGVEASTPQKRAAANRSESKKKKRRSIAADLNVSAPSSRTRSKQASK